MKPPCSCVSGERCRNCALIGRAFVRLLCYRSRLGHLGNGLSVDPVLWADTMTGRHDCRIALNLARGVPIEAIHPANGTSAYRNEPADLALFEIAGAA